MAKDRAYQHGYRRTVTGRYAQLKAGCKRLGREMSLSVDEFTHLVSLPCFYCGALPDGSASKWLDRKDNSRGYSNDNVLPCCWPCNEMRGDRFTVREMIVLWETLKGFRRAMQAEDS